MAFALRGFQRALIAVGFTLAAAAALLAAGAGAVCVARGSVAAARLPLGLPELPFTVRLDPLAGFFLVVIGLLTLFVSIYSLGYVRGYLGHRPVTRLVVFYGLFIAGMLLVVLANDALFFLVAWEVMATASYFLVVFEDERVENRRAAFLYIVVAHVGAVAILLSFGILAGLGTGFSSFAGYSFDAMRQLTLPPRWATAAFLLAVFGFAAKAGVVPLHVWLPEAHPVAPSNVSALMSGVMLKIAIYGIVRVAFDLLGDFPWWWGAILLVLGLVTAVLGVLYALMQHDLKRLLAYSSVENIGIILMGLGLSMIFRSFELPLLARARPDGGALPHAQPRPVQGAALHGRRRGAVRDARAGHGAHGRADPPDALDRGAVPRRRGGDLGAAALQRLRLGVADLPGLPALARRCRCRVMKLLIPMAAALLALTSALAAACFVKAFGVTFLGHWRGARARAVHEAGWAMRAGMLLAAVGCLALGVLPPPIIGWMDAVSQQLVGAGVGSPVAGLGWLWLTPVAPERASYSGAIVFLGLLLGIPAVYLLLHIRPGAIHRVPIWDCGFEKLTARMQYTGTAFAMPLRRIFGYLFAIREQVRRDAAPRRVALPAAAGLHAARARPGLGLVLPAGRRRQLPARAAGRPPAAGNIQTYLIYSFVTIIVLLVFLR